MPTMRRESRGPQFGGSDSPRLPPHTTLQQEGGSDGLQRPTTFVATTGVRNDGGPVDSDLGRSVKTNHGVNRGSVIIPSDFVADHESGDLLRDGPTTPLTVRRTINTGGASQSDAVKQGTAKRVNANVKKGMDLHAQLVNVKGVDPSLLAWSHNALSLANPERVAHAVTLFDGIGVVQKFGLDPVKLRCFVGLVQQGYLENPYHNFGHAYDVTHCIFLFIVRTSLPHSVNELDMLCLLVSALGHDLGHPGTTNTFQINTQSSLAVTYNDLSVLENFHAASLFRVLNQEKAGILTVLPSEANRKCKRRIVTLILNTDMAFHFDLLHSFQHGLKSSDGMMKDLVLSTLIHAADVSNPSREFEVAKEWGRLIEIEMMAEGDLESQRGLPVSPFMDRTRADLPGMQIGFITSIVQPLFRAITDFLPELETITGHLEKNLATWKELKSKKINSPLTAPAEIAVKASSLANDDVGGSFSQHAASIATYTQKAGPLLESDADGNSSSGAVSNTDIPVVRPPNEVQDTSPDLHASTSSGARAIPRVPPRNENGSRVFEPLSKGAMAIPGVPMETIVQERLREDLSDAKDDTKNVCATFRELRDRSGSRVYETVTAWGGAQNTVHKRDNSWKAPASTETEMQLERLKMKVRRVYDNYQVQLAIFIATIVALYGDDVRVILPYNRAQDDAFAYVALVIFFLFVFEIPLQLWMDSNIKTGYRVKSVYFFLDSAAALSMIFDFYPLLSKDEGKQGAEGVSLARAGRAARAGTRASRLLRLLRLMRVVKIFSLISKRWKKDGQVAPEQEKYTFSAAKIGSKMGNRISEKIILCVMLMIICTTVLGVDPIRSEARYTLLQLDIIGRSGNESLLRDGINAFAMAAESEWPPMKLLDYNFMLHHSNGTQSSVSGPCVERAESPVRTEHGNLPCIEDGTHRISDLIIIFGNVLSFGGIGPFGLMAGDAEEMRISPGTRWVVTQEAQFSVEGWFNIATTTFVVVVLAVMSHVMLADVKEIVIRPIETILTTVERISMNPLSSTLGEDIMQEDDETSQVHDTVVKMARLLQVGFGAAGAEIIAQNISGSGEIDVMIQGKRMRAIIGFCDIRSFTDATELLQEDVMLFVNAIAAIVHEHTVESHGDPNKNIGDAFLCVWKLEGLADETPEASPGGSVGALKKGQKSSIALKRGSVTRATNSETMMHDGAFMAFVQVIRNLKSSQAIVSLLHNPKHNMQNFEVKMGFGLHTGWAIEGAIGSSAKVEASYLSPNVNMASRLEAATKQYGVDLLVSGDFYQGTSVVCKGKCRKVDCVTVKGSKVPIVLWAYKEASFEVSPTFSTAKRVDSGDHELPMRTALELLSQPSLDVGKILEHFSRAVDAYLAGEWDLARRLLAMWSTAFPDDKPAAVLLRFMDTHRDATGITMLPPEGWQGYRALTEK